MSAWPKWVINVWVVLFMTACADQEASFQVQPPAVRVAPVTMGHLERDYRLSGVVRPVERAQLAFQTDGVLLERLVELGDSVAAGQLLATVRNPRLAPEQAAAAAAVDETRARRDQAKRDLQRLRRLRKDNAVGEEQVEQKAAELAALEAAIERAGAELRAVSGIAAEARLLAPFDGEITQVLAQPGEYLAPGRSVLAMGATGQLEIPIRIPAELGQLKAGERVSVFFPEIDYQIEAPVNRIANQGDLRSGLFPAIVDIVPDTEQASHSALRAGLRAEVRIHWRSPTVQQLLPLTAIVDPIGGAPRVFRAREGVVDVIPVSIIGHQGEWVAIESQLEPGDSLVISGHQSLTAGQRVQVLP